MPRPRGVSKPLPSVMKGSFFAENLGKNRIFSPEDFVIQVALFIGVEDLVIVVRPLRPVFSGMGRKAENYRNWRGYPVGRLERSPLDRRLPAGGRWPFERGCEFQISGGEGRVHSGHVRLRSFSKHRGYTAAISKMASNKF